MKPLLAHTYEPHRITYPCYVQPKLNGVRALYQGGCFQSRDELPWNEGILSHIARELQAVIYNPSFILDGELYVHGWPLQRINGAVTPVRQSQSSDTPLVEYHIFDRVDFTKSFHDRWNSLPHGLRLDRVSFVETRQASSFADADAAYAEWVSQGYEGMMYRLGDCPYTVPKQPRGFGIWKFDGPNHRSKHLSDKNNRTWHLLKRKDWQDDEYICVGVEEGEGKYKGTLGAFKCSTTRLDRHPENLKIMGQHFTVGSGVSDSDRDYYFANPPIGRLIKVKYLCLSSDGIPLNPTILAIL